MWTVNSEVKSALLDGLFTHRLIISVEDAKPFVYANGVYEHVASLADMHLLPEDTGALHRENSIDLVFRAEYYATELKDIILEDLTKLYLISQTVYEVSDEILCSFGGTINESSSSSSEGHSSSSSTEIHSTSSSSTLSGSSRSTLSGSRSSSSSEPSSGSTMETSTSQSSSSSTELLTTSSSISSDFRCCDEWEFAEPAIASHFTNINLTGLTLGNAPDCELEVRLSNRGRQSVLVYNNSAVVLARGTTLDSSPQTIDILEFGGSGVSGTMDWDGTAWTTLTNAILYCYPASSQSSSSSSEGITSSSSSEGITSSSTSSEGITSSSSSSSLGITSDSSSSGVPWTPAMVTTDFWYDFSDSSTITETSGFISQIDDKSGNGYNLVQSNGAYQPVLTTLNGVQAARFYDSSAKSLRTQSTEPIMANSFSYFIMGAASFGPGAGNLMLTSDFRFVSDWQSDTDLYWFHRPYGSSVYATNLQQIAPNTPCVFGYGINYTLGGMYNYLDGSVNVSNGFVSAGNTDGSNRYLYIGNTSSPVDARIGEYVGIANDLLNSITRQRLEGYLAHKWGTTASLPVSHPYKTSPPLV